MRFVVVKKFKSLNRRFVPGVDIDPADVIGAVSFEQWRNRGFIAETAPVSIAVLNDEIREDAEAE